MLTHDDDGHGELRKRFMNRLEKRAIASKKRGSSAITTGKPGEVPLACWKSNGFHCQHLPDDEQGILRVSIGGGDDLPVKLEYCNIRGGVGACIDLMERAIAALKDAP